MKVILVINLAIMLISLTQVVTGLRCYDCVYKEDHAGSVESCKDDPEESRLVTCAGINPSCLKMTGKQDGKHVVARLCSQMTFTDAVPKTKTFEQKCYTPKEFKEAGGSLNFKVGDRLADADTACFCNDSDGCNAGTGLRFGVGAAGLTLVFTLYTLCRA